MRTDDCYQIGYIVKTHGLKGEVKIVLDVDAPEQYEELESVYLERSGELVPFFVSQLNLQASGGLIRFEDIDTIEQSAELVGCGLYLPLDQLPKHGEGHYYYHELIGYEVWQGEMLIGKVDQIYQPSSQSIASVLHEGREVLIPIADDIVLKVDKQQKRLEVSLPDGLLDIYTNS